MKFFTSHFHTILAIRKPIYKEYLLRCVANLPYGGENCSILKKLHHNPNGLHILLVLSLVCALSLIKLTFQIPPIYFLAS